MMKTDGGFPLSWSSSSLSHDNQSVLVYGDRSHQKGFLPEQYRLFKKNLSGMPRKWLSGGERMRTFNGYDQWSEVTAYSKPSVGETESEHELAGVGNSRTGYFWRPKHWRNLTADKSETTNRPSSKTERRKTWRLQLQITTKIKL